MKFVKSPQIEMKFSNDEENSNEIDKSVIKIQNNNQINTKDAYDAMSTNAHALETINQNTCISEGACNKNLSDEIEQALNIEDPITQKIEHKRILEKIKSDFSDTTFFGFSNFKNLQKFLLTSFKMFFDDKNFDICLNILLKNQERFDLNEFTEIIAEMLNLQKYKNIARELINEINNKSEVVKRIKKVSFVKKADVLYIKKEDASKEGYKNFEGHKRIQEFEGYKKDTIVEFKTPVKLVNEYCKNSFEAENQKKRENDKILFVNTNLNQKFDPSYENLECEKENLDLCVELPLVNLNLKNSWKKFDFTKILDNKEFNIKEILNDPKIIDEFQA